MADLPPLTVLAEARMRANDGKYLVLKDQHGVSQVRRLAKGRYEFVVEGTSLDHAAGQYDPQHIVNAAEARDNGLDIQEEIADAWNIAQLWEQRVQKAQVMDETYYCQFLQLRMQLISLDLLVRHIRSRLPETWQGDQYPVQRILPREAVDAHTRVL